jgi:glycosyltransferase involved in cell wall biosynthesis
VISAPTHALAAELRVLLVDSGREWRGGQAQVHLLARELSRTPGVTVRLVTDRAGELARRARDDQVVVRGAAWGMGLDPRALWTLAREMRRFRPAILHVHDSHALSLATLARAWASKPGAHVVATRRVDFHLRRSAQWRRAARVIAVSDAVARVLRADGVAASRIVVVRDGIDVDGVRRAAATPLDVRAQLGLPPGTPLAVNVAALVPHKDHRTLIAAAALAADRRPDLHWVVAGDGPLRHLLEDAIADARMEGRVHLLGYVPAADALIAEGNVFVMSSREEGLGSVVLNARALGKPVVATRAGGLPEIAPPEGLVAVGDAGALAQAVVRALERPDPTALLPEFTAAAMARGVLAIYRSLEDPHSA